MIEPISPAGEFARTPAEHVPEVAPLLAIDAIFNDAGLTRIPAKQQSEAVRRLAADSIRRDRFQAATECRVLQIRRCTDLQTVVDFEFFCGEATPDDAYGLNN